MNDSSLGSGHGNIAKNHKAPETFNGVDGDELNRLVCRQAVIYLALNQ